MIKVEKKSFKHLKIIKWRKAPAIYWPAETKFPPVNLKQFYSDQV